MNSRLGKGPALTDEEGSPNQALVTLPEELLGFAILANVSVRDGVYHPSHRGAVDIRQPAVDVEIVLLRVPRH